MIKNSYKLLFLVTVLVLIGLGFYYWRYTSQLSLGPSIPSVKTYDFYPPAYPKELTLDLARFEIARETDYPSGEKEIKLQYISMNSLTNVLKFYNQMLERGEWQVVETQKTDSENLIKTQKGGQQIIFNFVPQDKFLTRIQVDYSLTKVSQ